MRRAFSATKFITHTHTTTTTTTPRGTRLSKIRTGNESTSARFRTTLVSVFAGPNSSPWRAGERCVAMRRRVATAKNKTRGHIQRRTPHNKTRGHMQRRTPHNKTTTNSQEIVRL